MTRKLLFAALLAVALLPAAGCGKKDTLETAAPPPSPEAAERGPEATVTKNMPGPRGTTNMGGPARPGGPGAPGLAGPAAKPPGL